MTKYQVGFKAAELDIADFGLERATEVSDMYNHWLPRLSMFRIGYKTCVGVAMERVWA